MAVEIPSSPRLTNRPSLGRPQMPGSGVRRLIGGAALLFLLTMVGACVTTSVGPGERAVKYSNFSGTNLNKVYGEGLQLTWPWEHLIVYDIRSLSRDEALEALSANGLTIRTDVSVRYRPIAQRLPRLHTTLGQDYYERLIQPELRSAAREVIGHYTPEELYSTRRNELQDRIAQRVAAVARQADVEVEAVLIRDIVLPDQIRQAIEMKLQEEQRVQQLTFTIQREQREAERRRIEAEGQAAAQRILNASLTPQLLRYEGIQATRALAESANAKVVVIGNGADGLPLILGND